MTKTISMQKKEKIREMFDNIASDYDKLNHIMSLDVDKLWRKDGLKSVLSCPNCCDIMDLACGTGDFSIAIAKAAKKRQMACRIVGVDMSEGMLAIMEEKLEKEGLEDIVSIQVGDGENIAFPDNSFDCVCIAFGIRNFQDRERGLREMYRVLRPGGRIVILELSRPENALFRAIYDLYFLHILPFIGAKISGQKAAYKYLPASVVGFPKHKDFSKLIADCGFQTVRHKSLSMGLCRKFVGTK